MASSIALLLTLHKSHFLAPPIPPLPYSHQARRGLPARAKFDLSELMGGRGLCKGEKGLERELSRNISDQTRPEKESFPPAAESGEEAVNEIPIPESAFEKELLGMTGGFPGGEKGVLKFVEKFPPPSSPEKGSVGGAEEGTRRSEEMETESRAA